MYMITAATFNKEPFFSGTERLHIFYNALLEVCARYVWQLQAWAIFPNHYHIIAQSPGNAYTLRKLIQRLHSQTARTINRLDSTPQRRVWFQYWDTCLRTEKSYYGRLRYVNHNAVKHGLVDNAFAYPFCSARWFKTYAHTALFEQVETATEEPNIATQVPDDFILV